MKGVSEYLNNTRKPGDPFGGVQSKKILPKLNYAKMKISN